MIRRLLIAIVLCLYAPVPLALSESAAHHATAELGPVLVLDFPKTVRDRQLVRIDASKSGVDDLAWRFIEPPADSWTVEGRVGLFAASPGRHRIIVAGAKCVDGKAKVEIGEVVLSVEGMTPPIAPPPITPDPPVVGPDPLPPLPQPTGLAAQVKSLVLSLVDAGQQRQIVSVALSTWYTAWAAKGANQPVKEFVAESNRKVDAVLKAFGAGDDPQWSRFRDELARKLAAMRLTTTAQHCEAWRNIGKGLMEAAQSP